MAALWQMALEPLPPWTTLSVARATGRAPESAMSLLPGERHRRLFLDFGSDLLVPLEIRCASGPWTNTQQILTYSFEKEFQNSAIAQVTMLAVSSPCNSARQTDTGSGVPETCEHHGCFGRPSARGSPTYGCTADTNPPPRSSKSSFNLWHLRITSFFNVV